MYNLTREQLELTREALIVHRRRLMNEKRERIKAPFGSTKTEGPVLPAIQHKLIQISLVIAALDVQLKDTKSDDSWTLEQN